MTQDLKKEITWFRKMMNEVRKEAEKRNILDKSLSVSDHKEAE